MDLWIIHEVACEPEFPEWLPRCVGHKYYVRYQKVLVVPIFLDIQMKSNMPETRDPGTQFTIV